MPRATALFRALNVGGHNAVPMARLRAFGEELGLCEVSTLLQSGNLAFSTSSKTPETLERKIQAEVQKRLGISADVFVRTGEDWKQIVDANPYPREAQDDPSHLVVMVLKETPKPGALDSLRTVIRGRETAKAGARELYLYYPDGIGDSKLTASVIEKATGVRGTARNWNTVLKLLKLCFPDQGS